MIMDELFHQRLALGTFDVDDLDASLPEVILAPHEGVVFAQNHSLYLVENACTRAHVTW